MSREEGTIVQHRDGYKFIKTERGWEKLSRFLVEQEEGRKLRKYERVFHKDGQRAHDEYPNLVAIQFNATRFRPLPESRVIYIPSTATRRHEGAHRSAVMVA